MANINMAIATVASAVLFMAMILLPAQASAQVVIALDDELEKYWIVEKKVAPDYPRMALRRGKMGCVALAYIIQADGTTADHKVLAFYPSDIFDKSAIKAAKQFKYIPSVQNPDKTPALSLNVFTYHVSDDSHGGDERGEEKRKLLHDLCSEAGKKALEPALADADPD
ncbi:MAG: energy transducer TonB [Gammaproteobacteria bacterium]|nr:energy transducer TonB [Gammaproteobacteria bacterium]